MLKKKQRTKIFVVSGPSGSGKTTIINRLFLRKKMKDSFVKVVTATTRRPRKGEKEGKDYIFLSEKEFKDKEKNGWFIETKEFSGNWYGTPEFYISRAKKQNKDVLFCIDVEGALKIKELYPRESVLIFVYPPSEEELSRRLCARNTESEKVIKKRLRIAKSEVKYSTHYTYGLVNNVLIDAVNALETIITAERLTI